MIDLRSDVIAPTAAMRRAMAEAELGDELFGEDPSARRLEAYTAQLLGKEASLLVPTCTLGNAVAVLAHGCGSEWVLMDIQAHIHRREMHPPSTLATLRPEFYDTPDGCPDVEHIRRFCTSSNDAGLVCLETTHTWRQGQAISLERLQAVSAEAHRHGARVHLDGARLFYAAAALDADPAQIAATADSVVVSLCKGIRAPAGAMLAGSAAFIAAARSILCALGGTLRMPGMLAVAGLLALQTGLSGLNRDFVNAQRLAQAMAGFGVRAADFPTNVVLFDPSDHGLSGAQFADLALQAGMRVALLAPNLVRLTTHSDLSDADVNKVVEVLNNIVERHSRGAV